MIEGLSECSTVSGRPAGRGSPLAGTHQQEILGELEPGDGGRGEDVLRRWSSGTLERPR